MRWQCQMVIKMMLKMILGLSTPPPHLSTQCFRCRDISVHTLTIPPHPHPSHLLTPSAPQRKLDKVNVWRHNKETNVHVEILVFHCTPTSHLPSSQPCCPVHTTLLACCVGIPLLRDGQLATVSLRFWGWIQYFIAANLFHLCFWRIIWISSQHDDSRQASNLVNIWFWNVIVTFVARKIWEWLLLQDKYGPPSSCSVRLSRASVEEGCQASASVCPSGFQGVPSSKAPL